ncbi:MAG: 16S rRNA (uracil(1498)-N(3))-methyltransferase [Vicinamibacterales bacterium]|nr:16S rRNA (uracil(1498)-N(3))-methyltransferase [Vicinamibacterales bacterium]HJO18262.1 16S rRNA (uracil(1498)-N(3))-methyltransferase [Vicinamibacterales bacterium]|tara:strand:+ start:2276 stop:3022 length:747 start_codon:yes stop_codon:yes gene_type:complete
MRSRFFAPDLKQVGEAIVLSLDESRHLCQVLRLGVKDEIRVFDGQGSEYLARVESVGRLGVTVRLLEPTVPAPEASVTITLAAVVLKGRRFDVGVREATMLGVSVVQPLRATRQAVHGPSILRSGGVARWQRIAVAAAKQCGRAVVPEIREVATVEAFTSTDQSKLRLVLVEPGVSRADAVRPRSLALQPQPQSVSLAVGPEGGWATDDLNRFISEGFQVVTLGGRILRAETVPIVALAMLVCLWDDS